jgi:hypothetical protein
MAETSKPHTHNAFTRQRFSRTKFGPWIKIGSGRLDQDGAEIILRVLPIGGFSGYVRLLPNGKAPPLPEPEPQRPGESAGDEENFEG